MKKIKNLVIGGIESKVLILILSAAILITAAFLGATLYQSNTLAKLTEETSARQQAAISEITSSVMDQVVEQGLDRSTQLEAMLANELFHGLKTRVEMLGDYAQKLFEDPEGSPQADWAVPDPAQNGEVTAQVILADGVDAASVASRLGTAANMSDLMISLFGVSDVTNSCFVALPEGAFLVVDDRSSSKFADDGTQVAYDPRTRPWYRQAVEQGGLIFTDVEIDAFTGDIGIVCAMPVYVGGKLEAVVGSDLFLTSMQAAVQSSDENGGFLFVVNQAGHVVFSPKTEGPYRVLNASEAVDLRQSENVELAALVADAMREKTDVRRVDGCYMIGAPMETVGWALIAAFREDIAAQPVEMLQERYGQIQQEAVVAYRSRSRRANTSAILLLVLLVLVLCSGALLLGKRIVQPLNTITRRISELSTGNLEFRMEDAYRTGDEIEVLAESFASLSHKTVQYVDEVRRVTAEKERIGTELHMANQIQESVLPSIFPAFPDRPEFDLYATMEPAKEVGGDFYDFFLIDDDHLCLVMADVSGKGVPAALFMMISKVIVQSCAMLRRSAAEILTKTNEALCSNNQVEMFVTVWVGILEISTGRLTAANAGHEYPILQNPGGRFEVLKDKHGFVIGGMEGAKYREYEIDLAPGARLFLYTDGVPEAMDAEGRMFGLERTLEALNNAPDATPRQSLEAVRRAVGGFVRSAEQFDDMTMLCLEYNGRADAE